MKKKLYFQLSDNCDVSNLVFNNMATIASWIEDEVKEVSEEDLAEFEYTITPILLTDEEFEKLQEADI